MYIKKQEQKTREKRKTLLKKHVKICKRLKTLCTLMGSWKGWSCPFSSCRLPGKCIKNADTAATGKRQQRHSHVQISTCQFMIMAPHEPKQNVNYTPPTK